MDFDNIQLEDVLKKLDNLDPNTKPSWGTMSAQRMVEHLTDTFDLALGKFGRLALEIPEDKVNKAQAFIRSDKEMPKNFQAKFAPKEYTLRNEDIQLAIDELSMRWVDFETFFEENSGLKTMHPNFGELDFDLWKKVISKHIKHHLKQFDLIE